MKKILIIYYFLFVGLNLFSQNYNYGLSQEDLNLILGQYVMSAETHRYEWVAQSFSWGRQTAILLANGIVVKIDYSNDFAARLGEEFRGYLVLTDSSLPFLISNIEKLADNRFLLSLILMANPNDALKNAGQITITYLDNIHIVIDNTNLLVNSLNYMVLWKSAGPTITVRNKRNFLELPDFQRN